MAILKKEKKNLAGFQVDKLCTIFYTLSEVKEAVSPPVYRG